MSSHLLNKVKENIKIINDKDESYLIRSLLRDELENIRTLLNEDAELNEKLASLRKRIFSDGAE